MAIDGPGGAGKSTIAKLVAKKLGIDYIDTGAMYRSVGYKAMIYGIDPSDDQAMKSMLDGTDIDFDNGVVMLDGVDVSSKIRTQEVSAMASKVASLSAVRTKLVDMQRNIGMKKSVVMDGRDIGTNVFKDAKYKFFLTASPEERAKRRFDELKAKGEDVNYDEILEDIEERDYRDTHRELNPLRKAEDAVEVDTTSMNIEQVANTLMNKMGE
ncbi:MAG: (d)CMP kinase [Eubacteriales bacterium]|nr:(d)CMP kinase [Eubacteriales bacterium]